MEPPSTPQVAGRTTFGRRRAVGHLWPRGRASHVYNDGEGIVDIVLIMRARHTRSTPPMRPPCQASCRSPTLHTAQDSYNWHACAPIMAMDNGPSTRVFVI